MTPMHRTLAGLLTIATAFTAARAEAQNKGDHVYAAMVLFNVNSGQEENFLNAIQAQKVPDRDRPSFLNDRILVNVDELTLQYASYTKFSRIGPAVRFLDARLEAARPLCRREPEAHLVQLTTSYTPKGEIEQPTGLDFGNGRTGQTSHLGLFIPYPARKGLYDQTLRDVKQLMVGRNPAGYIGEDLAEEVDPGPPSEQTPYSPRRLEDAAMSINYGEYDTFENAEDSYVARQDPADPRFVINNRTFYSVLQVPTRFFIFRVVSNKSGDTSTADAAAQPSAITPPTGRPQPGVNTPPKPEKADSKRSGGVEKR